MRFKFAPEYTDLAVLGLASFRIFTRFVYSRTRSNLKTALQEQD